MSILRYRTSPRNIEPVVSWLPGPAGAGSEFEARRNKINAQIASQQDYNDKTIALRKKGAIDPASWDAFSSWLPEWNSFVSRWGKFQTDTAWNWVTGPDETMLRDFEEKCYDLRKQYEAIPGVAHTAVTLDEPYKAPPTGYEWAKLAERLATLAVFGLGIYYGGKLIITLTDRFKGTGASGVKVRQVASTPAPRALPAATGSASGLEPWPSYESGCLPCERKG